MKLNIFKRNSPPAEYPTLTLNSPAESISEKNDDDYFTDDLEALDVVADMLYRTCLPLGWVPAEQIHSDDWTDEVVLGILLKTSGGAMRTCPMAHDGMASFEVAAMGLKVSASLKMRSRAVEYTVKHFIDTEPDLFELYINANTRIQVLSTMDHLVTARRSQYGAFIRDEGVLVVWADSVDSLIPTAQALEQSLLELIRSGRRLNRGTPLTPFTPTQPNGQMPDALPIPDTTGTSDPEKGDPEKAIESVAVRPVSQISAVTNGLAFMLTIVLMGIGLNGLLVRFTYDKDYMRFPLVLVFIPCSLIVALTCSFFVSNLFYIFGPISQYTSNSVYYSAIPPSRDNISKLLPITVQMPVYKESLEEVLIPTIESVKVAMTTFERQGGSVNLIVCDDGMQLLSEADRRARIQCYSDNDLAYVARPPHGVDGFERRGKFKKAGNLNHTNKLSLEIEEEMANQRPALSEELRQWTETNEKALYERVKEDILVKREGKTWASGNIRIGEVILLIDSDTRVPTDCFLDASLEMTECPDVAVIQHQSGVMQVAFHFFENLMTYFTRLIQLGISMTVAGGSVAPFVGHNAFLRWSALQEVAFVDPYDNEKRCWSEEHVSEDFQMALHLQSKGWIIRWATYAGHDFEEGVSLTCIDELNRWQKYAWGCSEIIFNPFKTWFKKGPITKLFRTFLWSSMAPHSKFGVLAYIFSYYAISTAWVMSIVSFVLVGVMGISDTFYVTSWDVFFVCVLLFMGLSNLAICILHYRLKIPDTGKFVVQLIVFLPIFNIFFIGLSFPIATALVFHLLSIDMTWSATSKSVERSNVFKQLPKIMKRFWFQIGLSVVVLAGIVLCTTTLIPIQYRVKDTTSIIPLAITYAGHLLWPFILDPYLLTFSY